MITFYCLFHPKRDIRFWGCPLYLSNSVAACASEIAIRFEGICVLSVQLYRKFDESTMSISLAVKSLASRGVLIPYSYEITEDNRPHVRAAGCSVTAKISILNVVGNAWKTRGDVG